MQRHITEQTAIFISVVKWVFLSSFIGVIIGAVITLFLKILQYSEESQSLLPFKYYYLLPFALVLTVWIIRTFAPTAEGHGTEKVIDAVHNDYGKIDISVIPVKLFATVLTIFAGGSVGKEGPAAQIGAGVSSWLSVMLKFSKQDRKKLVICGISAGFASVFGTPIAGAIFGVEVLIIGVIMYDVLLPSFIAGFAAFTTAQLLGIDYTYYDLHFYQNVVLDLPLIGTVVFAGLFFGFISDILVTSTKAVHTFISKLSFHPDLKAFVGGIIIVVLALIFGEEYLGLGITTIESLLNPAPFFSQDIPWYAFLLKMLFTAITLGAGGSGGILTPVFFIGASSGHAFASFVDPSHIALFAGLGFVSVLAGTTNTPIAATIMAVELFGLDMAHYAALSTVISFLISGHRSVFPSQILAMRKSEMIEIKVGEEIAKTEAALENKEQEKINRVRNRLHKKREELNKKKRHKKD